VDLFLSVVVYFGNNTPVNVDPDGDGKDLGAAAAMTAAFGDSYTGLSLKYNKWKDAVGIVADSTMLGHVDNSGFNEGNLGNLLTSVQYLVDELAGVVDGGSVSITDEAWAKFMEDNGISTSDGRTAANATTMFVADTVSGYASSDEKKAEFWEKWYTQNFDFTSTTGTRFGTEACRFAFTMALATYVDQQTAGSAAPTQYVNSLQTASGTQIVANIGAVQSAIGSNHYDKYLAWMGMASDADMPSTSSRCYSDCMAFLAYMGGLDNSTDSLMADTNLSAENYYGDGNIHNYINSYIDTGRVLANCPDGAMAFTFSNGKVLCNPLDY